VLAEEVEPAAERAAALARLISHYQQTADPAQRRLSPDRAAGPPPSARDGVSADAIPDYESAIRTLATISSAVVTR
jgi:hypothetical protein